MVVRHHGKIVADIPAKKIADESPVYQRESREPEYLKEVRAFRLDGIPDTPTPIADLLKLLAWPTIASKNWVYRQYDHMVRDGSVVCPGSDAAVLRIKADSLPEVDRLPACLKLKMNMATGRMPVRKTHRADGGLQWHLRLSRSLRRREDCDGRGVPQSGLFRRGAAGRRRTISTCPAR